MLFSFLKRKSGCLSFGWSGACTGYGFAVFRGLEL